MQLALNEMDKFMDMLDGHGFSEFEFWFVSFGIF